MGNMDSTIAALIKLFAKQKGLKWNAQSGSPTPRNELTGIAKARRAKSKRKRIQKQRYVERRKSYRRCRKKAS